jgi:hypothetical protein
MKKWSNRPKVTERFPMAEHSLFLGSATISVPKQRILKICETFQDNSDLLKSRSHIRSSIYEEVLRMFLVALDGSAPELTTANMNDFSLLCEEFGFVALLSHISEFRLQHTVFDNESRKGVYQIEEQIRQ